MKLSSILEVNGNLRALTNLLDVVLLENCAFGMWFGNRI